MSPVPSTVGNGAVAIVDGIEETGIRRVDTGETSSPAADFKFCYSPALGDAFALATATSVDGMLPVGADAYYDDIDEVQIIRYRTEPA